MARLLICIMMVFMLAGCATTGDYDPLQSALKQTVLLNESGFAAVKEGMSMEDIHTLMGETIIIGYISDAALQKPTVYKPLTISNPYKSEEITTASGAVVVEYYVARINQPDGIVSDNELVPLVFKDGKLYGRGWPFLQNFQSKK